MCMDSRSVTVPAWEDAPAQPLRDQKSVIREEAGHVRLEISADRLHELLKVGALCASDFRCLDCESKQCVWRLCLVSCVKHFVPRPMEVTGSKLV